MLGKPEFRSPRASTLGDYAHSYAYRSPIGYSDKMENNYEVLKRPIKKCLENKEDGETELQDMAPELHSLDSTYAGLHFKSQNRHSHMGDNIRFNVLLIPSDIFNSRQPR